LAKKEAPLRAKVAELAARGDVEGVNAFLEGEGASLSTKDEYVTNALKAKSTSDDETYTRELNRLNLADKSRKDTHDVDLIRLTKAVGDGAESDVRNARYNDNWLASTLSGEEWGKFGASYVPGSSEIDFGTMNPEQIKEFSALAAEKLIPEATYEATNIKMLHALHHSSLTSDERNKLMDQLTADRAKALDLNPEQAAVYQKALNENNTAYMSVIAGYDQELEDFNKANNVTWMTTDIADDAVALNDYILKVSPDGAIGGVGGDDIVEHAQDLRTSGFTLNGKTYDSSQITDNIIKAAVAQGLKDQTKWLIDSGFADKKAMNQAIANVIDNHSKLLDKASVFAKADRQKRENATAVLNSSNQVVEDKHVVQRGGNPAAAGSMNKLQATLKGYSDNGYTVPVAADPVETPAAATPAATFPPVTATPVTEAPAVEDGAANLRSSVPTENATTSTTSSNASFGGEVPLDNSVPDKRSKGQVSADDKVETRTAEIDSLSQKLAEAEKSGARSDVIKSLKRNLDYARRKCIEAEAANAEAYK